jgi:hypothetical protein
MDETNFDALCEGASPQEAKRLRKILSEWCQGDEDSFPVQLAMLTRAQWRVAARMPQQLVVARQQLDQAFAEHQRQAHAAFDEFTHEIDTRTGALEQIIARHTDTTKKIVAEMRVELTHTEVAAKRIQNQLEAGVAGWQKAQTDFTTQRDRLVEKVIEIRNGYTQQEWFCVILILAAVFTFGIVIGMRSAR